MGSVTPAARSPRWHPVSRRLASMLRAAALAATAGLRPLLGRRLLSAAAAQAVPAPNQQPEIFYNKVRPALFSVRSRRTTLGATLRAGKFLATVDLFIHVGHWGSLWTICTRAPQPPPPARWPGPLQLPLRFQLSSRCPLPTVLSTPAPMSLVCDVALLWGPLSFPWPPLLPRLTPSST